MNTERAIIKVHGDIYGSTHGSSVAALSHGYQLDFCVPQGSALGPNMCCMYTNPAGEIIRK